MVQMANNNQKERVDLTRARMITPCAERCENAQLGYHQRPAKYRVESRLIRFAIRFRTSRSRLAQMRDLSSAKKRFGLLPVAKAVRTCSGMFRPLPRLLYELNCGGFVGSVLFPAEPGTGFKDRLVSVTD
jgi:hypothetical protein